MISAVKIAPELHSWLDAAVEQVVDEFGGRKYHSKKDVVDDAVKRLMKELDIKPLEAAA